MRKPLLLCCCLLATALPLACQVYTTNFHHITQQVCPFDSTKTVTYPTGWVIYQTLDGAWDGIVDSSRCISCETMSGGDLQIDLGQINPTQPIFVRALPEELATMGELPVNKLMAIDFFWGTSGDFMLGSNCVQDMCSGVFAGVDVGVPGAMRIHTGLVTEETFEHSCFPTEYFPGQNLRELILKITYSPDFDPVNKSLNLYGVLVSPSWSEPGLIAAVPASGWQYNDNTNEYDVYVSDAADPTGGGEQFLILYTEPTFPSIATPAYVTGSVDPPSSQQETINLVVDFWQYLEIQPFTHLRGDLVEGSDSIRHIVNLWNNGGSLCLNFIDLIFNDGSQYRHGKGGTINMHNSFSCFQFRDGSALRVLEDATLHYGNEGAGMLALCANSTIVLERNATLLVDAVLNIAECDDATAPTHIYIDLPKSASLIFTENARLTNRFSQGQQMELHVRMLGGTLDDSRLSAEDKALIRRIYPAPSPVFADNFSLSPNPFQHAPVLSYLSAGAEQLTLQWLSVDGKILGEKQLAAQVGMNEWLLENTPPGAGWHWLHISNARHSAVLKVVQID